MIIESQTSQYFDDFCIVYLNDILIYYNNFEKHQKHIHKILDKLKKKTYLFEHQKVSI